MGMADEDPGKPANWIAFQAGPISTANRRHGAGIVWFEPYSINPKVGAAGMVDGRP